MAGPTGGQFLLFDTAAQLGKPGKGIILRQNANNGTPAAIAGGKSGGDTADAISFNDGFLRIHDLKTGAVPAHMEQLYIYAALFCLEYGYHPKDIRMELRIYQNDEVWVENPTEEEIDPIIAKIKEFDPIITDILLGVAA